MVLKLSKERSPAQNCLQALPNLLPIRRQSSDSRLNAHAPEFVPNKRLVYARIAPEKMMPTTGQGVRQEVAGAKPLPVVKSKKSHSAAVSKSPKNNQSVLKTENVHSQAEEGSADPVACSPPRVKPAVSDDLKAKIVKQAEFYFSDANLATDNFLMKLLKKDPEGFVPISVVASFSKIKNLVKNHGTVAAALKTSSQLVLSKDGKKVRRTKLILDIDSKEVQARTVVAENFPENHSTEDITHLFGGIGNVQMVRICHPGTSDNPKFAVMEYLKADILVSNKLHALVVYESVNEAERAVKELTNESNWRTGLRVRLLLRRMVSQARNMPTGKKAETEAAEGSDGDEDSTSSVGSPDKSGDEHAQRADASQEYLVGALNCRQLLISNSNWPIDLKT
ncbi:hypothetical protein O6H91_06G062600 [Diphasiastrum complanatum]|uniref:Uncharacterized protein n=1 Tax=Diphasiastrum complanatum TaxID=34168 RepID=A0ACC2DE83_DIPCM|nr:hypothetical protein O6H91_06G062600 [Diphasiastrum complanatum]